MTKRGMTRMPGWWFGAIAVFAMAGCAMQIGVDGDAEVRRDARQSEAGAVGDAASPREDATSPIVDAGAGAPLDGGNSLEGPYTCDNETCGDGQICFRLYYYDNANVHDAAADARIFTFTGHCQDAPANCPLSSCSDGHCTTVPPCERAICDSNTMLYVVSGRDVGCFNP